MKTDLLDIRNADCMDMMREFPDGHFSLAIVDPPYGIFTKDATGFKNHLNKKLKDDTVPCAEYFSELKRVSRNQIIWGGNYFGDFLGAHRSPIVWDKQTGEIVLQTAKWHGHRSQLAR